MATALSNTQKRYLRGLAHDLKAVLIVGAKGITDALVAEAALALEHHELLKVKIHAGDRELRDEWIAELATRTDAALVTRIGNVAVFYRRRAENPLIVLPRN
ncbi:MAG TPA: ribosome assembly RNA-binding protein YhbY [Arenimonas sp.]